MASFSSEPVRVVGRKRAFAQDGSVKLGAEYNVELKKEIDRYKSVLGEVFLELQENPSSRGVTVVERFRSYLEEEKAAGRFTDSNYFY